MPLVDKFLPGPEFRSDQGITNTPGFHPRLYRPFLDSYGKPRVIINTGQWTREKGKRIEVLKSARVVDLLNDNWPVPLFALNATSLRKEDWIEMDKQVQKVARQRLRAWSDLAASSSYGGFNAFGRATLEYEAMSDSGEAFVDMEGVSEGRVDSPLFKLRSLPLPITHSNYRYTKRRLEISRNSNTPLDSASAEHAARKVAEEVEKVLIGINTGVTYATQSSGYPTHDLASTVFGYTNYTNRNTKTDLTTPTGANPDDTVTDVLEMLETLRGDNFYGPFVLYHSTDWDTYLDQDYGVIAGSSYGFAPGQTLRQRLRQIDGVQDVRRLDYLPSSSNPFTMIMVSMTSDTAQAIVGQDITTIQWEQKGGMETCFKVMCIYVPLLKSDYDGRCGILHATTS